jgi:glycosyltransferase involved in cell wall biosynthesis
VKDRALKIAITADPELPVPPRLYGGIERVVHLLVSGLASRGHDVTLFAHSDSAVPCTLLAYAGTRSRSPRDTVRNALMIARTVIGGRFDVVHSFGRLAYLTPLLPLAVPKVMTYQRAVTPRSVRWGARLSRGRLQFSAVSRAMIGPADRFCDWHVVYNGVPVDAFDFSPAVAQGAPLVFLGRVERIKGAHLAVEIAHRAGRRLIIAGNVPGEHEDYFAREIRPHLEPGRIDYVGPVDDRQKTELLGQAAALLMPIVWEEPFGIVMAEALACGTPVLGLRRGAVPEVIEHGVSGFVRDEVGELAADVARVAGLSRRACRQRAERMFSGDVMVEAYLDVYRAAARAGTGRRS